MTDEIRETILSGIRIGTGEYRAAQLAGISPQTYRRYLRQGEADMDEGRRTKAAEFVGAVRHAVAHIGKLMEGSVVRAALHDRDVKAAQWWLERRLPEEYGRRDTIAIEVRQQMTAEFLDFLRGRLDAETYNRVLDALAPSGSGEAESTPLLN
jgi:hypothetical protein